jgi:Transglycosylase SLT domain
MPTFALAENADASSKVDRWKQTALNAGWKKYHWPMVSCIISRETGGNPNLYNPEKQAGTPKGWGSYGLMQMYGWANRDWLLKFVGGDLRKLYNPFVNLKAAKKLYDMRGWRPWGGCRR